MTGAPPASLKDLLATAPRDLSGSRASNRFTYQKDWTLLLLMHLHAGRGDYLVVLDYHDDVIALDSSTSPAEAAFYQVKSNNGGNWTISQLTRQKKGKKGPLPSHIGKLWSHQVTFSQAICRCYFVTNGTFSFCSSASSEALGETTDCDLLASADYKILADKIQAELKLSAAPELKNKLAFIRSQLSVLDHSEHASGKLAKFITQRHPTGKFYPDAAYRAVADEIRRRADKEGVFASYDALHEHKGISRADFENMLLAIGAIDDLDVAWARYETALTNEGVAFSEVEAIRSAWKQFEIERMDVSNEELRALSRDAQNEINGFTHKTSSFALNEMTTACSTALAAKSVRSLSYLRAVVIMEYHHVRERQATHSQPKAATT